MAREITVKPDADLVTPDDALVIELKRKTPARESILTRQEFYALLQAAQRPEEKALLVLGILGLRATEIAKLNRAWIDFVDKVINIPDEAAKKGHGRRVPYGGLKLSGIIDAYFLMADRLPWRTRQGVYLALRRIAKLSGLVRPITPHGLRATGATWFAEAGYTEAELREHFGWSQFKTAQFYIERTGASALRAMREKGDKVL